MDQFIPSDVPSALRETFRFNYTSITKNSNRLLLFATDQIIEHLHDDFQHLSGEQKNPEYLFALAASLDIGAVAMHPGLICRYASRYPSLQYIAKISARTNMISTDPESQLLYDVQQIAQLAQHHQLPIKGIGLTVYLGSSFENSMLRNAAQAVYQAHQAGLAAILWIYMRGQTITHELDPHLTSGAAGLANALGADFVKLKPIHTSMQEAVVAAGNTGILCAGGELIDEHELIKTVTEHVLHDGIRGYALGRNLFQRSTHDAQALCAKVARIIYQ